MNEPLHLILEDHEKSINKLADNAAAQTKLLKTVLTLLVSTGTIERSELVKLLKK